MNDLETENFVRSEVIKITLEWWFNHWGKWERRLEVSTKHAATFIKKIEHSKRPCLSGRLPGNVRIAHSKRIKKRSHQRRRELIRACEMQRRQRENSREDD